MREKPGFSATRLTLRFHERVNEGGGTKPGAPIPADGVLLGADLTLVRRTKAGEAHYVGALPAPGSKLEVTVAGCWPTTVDVPHYLSSTTDLDLGKVLLERGFDLCLRFSSPSNVCGSRIVERNRPPEAQGSDLQDRQGLWVLQ